MVPLILLATASVAAEPSWKAIRAASWEPVTQADHDAAGQVQILRQTIGGIECYRGTADTDLEPSKLMEVVLDIPGSRQWSSAGITEAKLLGNKGNVYDYYQLLDVPGWTMSSDRFWFLRGTLEENGPSLALHWKKLDGGGPYKDFYESVRADHDSAIEPPVNVGAWEFVSTANGSRIHYTICSDTGGSIPDTVQSMATRKTLPDTVGDVVREARRRR